MTQGINEIKALVKKWTKEAQSSHNSDLERAAYEQCAHDLHNLINNGYFNEPKHIMSFPKGADNGTLGPDD